MSGFGQKETMMRDDQKGNAIPRGRNTPPPSPRVPGNDHRLSDPWSGVGPKVVARDGRACQQHARVRPPLVDGAEDPMDVTVAPYSGAETRLAGCRGIVPSGVAPGLATVYPPPRWRASQVFGSRFRSP